VQLRWFAGIMSTLLLSCAGPAQVRETVARPRVASSAAESTTSSSRAHKAPRVAARKPGAQTDPARPAFRGSPMRAASHTATVSEGDAESSDSSAEAHERALVAQGIEGTMSEYDVRATLDNRGEDFDRCHEPRGRARSGHIKFRIRILTNGEVGDVNVRQSNVRDRELVDCYAGVIMASRFSSPHGGYADVTWSTKVGRSRPRPDDVFERRVRWDAPSGGIQSPPASSVESSRSERSESRRERRRARRHRKGV